VVGVRAGLRPTLELARALPTLKATVLVDHVGLPGLSSNCPSLVLPWEEAATRTEELTCTPVPFDHPLWVVFSSGTTGLPKGIVHGHGGVLLEHLKTLALQSDLGPGDRLLWYTTTHWMMWNLVVSTLLTGATTCTYDGSPALLTQPDILWDLAARHRVTLFGTSPQYLLGMAKFGIDPTVHDLSAIRAVGCTGSALPASAHPWVRDHVGDRVQLASISGGTDVVSGFAGGAPVVPVWAGELSAPYLGVALAAYDEEGHPVVDQVGELVVTRPMPPMPLSFWNDPDGARYREAYFSTYPGVWRHGDWITPHLPRLGDRARPLRLHPQSQRRTPRQRRHPRRRRAPPRDHRSPGHRRGGAGRRLLDAAVRGPLGRCRTGRRPTRPHP
jgi:acetoacetyl-CoA synthetase